MSPTDLTNLGAQLSEVLNSFNELSVEMMAQWRVIDQLVAGGASDEQHEPLPPGQSEPQPIFLLYTQTSVASHLPILLMAHHLLMNLTSKLTLLMPIFPKIIRQLL